MAANEPIYWVVFREDTTAFLKPALCHDGENWEWIADFGQPLAVRFSKENVARNVALSVLTPGTPFSLTCYEETVAGGTVIYRQETLPTEKVPFRFRVRALLMETYIITADTPDEALAKWRDLPNLPVSTTLLEVKVV